jgi:hypothetical protein
MPISLFIPIIIRVNLLLVCQTFPSEMRMVEIKRMTFGERNYRVYFYPDKLLLIDFIYLRLAERVMLFFNNIFES